MVHGEKNVLLRWNLQHLDHTRVALLGSSLKIGNRPC